MNNSVWKSFAAQEVSHSMAHYLATIHDLIDERGYARVSDVAQELEISRGAASLQIKLLKERGLVEEDDHRHLRLTWSGESVSHRVIYTRTVLIRFLHDVLGVELANAELDACKIEHLLSPQTCQHILSVVRLFDSGDPVAKEFLKKCRRLQKECARAGDCGSCGDVCLFGELEELAKPSRGTGPRKGRR